MPSSVICLQHYIRLYPYLSPECFSDGFPWIYSPFVSLKCLCMELAVHRRKPTVPSVRMHSAIIRQLYSFLLLWSTVDKSQNGGGNAINFPSSSNSDLHSERCLAECDLCSDWPCVMALSLSWACSKAKLSQLCWILVLELKVLLEPVSGPLFKFLLNRLRYI